MHETEEEKRNVRAMVRLFRKGTMGNIVEECEMAQKRSSLAGMGVLIVIISVLQLAVRLGIYPTAAVAEINDSLRVKDLGIEAMRTESETKGADSIRLHKFDPNTADSLELLGLGISPRNISSLIKYRAKYPIRSVEQFFNLYCIKNWYSEYLRTYVSIPNARNKKSGDIHAYINQSKGRKSEAATGMGKTDLNAVDAKGLCEAFGVSESMAERIVKFRTLLGGFYSTEQIREVYGIVHKDADLIIRNSVCKNEGIKRIKINQIEANELKHPYLMGKDENKWGLSNALQKKIRRGERIKEFAEIEAMDGYDEERNSRLRHYIDFE